MVRPSGYTRDVSSWMVLELLEQQYQVEIGRCTYLFSRGDAMKNGMFESGLPNSR